MYKYKFDNHKMLYELYNKRYGY